MNKIKGTWWSINNIDNKVDGTLVIGNNEIYLELEGLLNKDMPFDLIKEDIILGNCNNNCITLYLCTPINIELSFSGNSNSKYIINNVIYDKHIYIEKDILNEI